jgi:hypothetical protein
MFTHQISELINVVTGARLVAYEPVDTNGCSASEFFKVTVEKASHTFNSFAKISNTASDWLSRRSRDIGREGRLLSSPLAERLWKYLHNPYQSIVTRGNEYGLLMEDISPLLIGYTGAQHIEDFDDKLLSVLAKIHAEFWNDSLEYETEYLMRPESYLSIIGPYNYLSHSTQPIARSVMSGWKRAMALLSPELAEWLRQPAIDIASRWERLPRTLLHGDFRPANIGLTDASVVLIDWAFCGYAPCTIDLYWYLATTSSWRGEIDTPIKKYRTYLESELCTTIDQNTWNELCRFGVVVACYMQLWDFSEQDSVSKNDWLLWTSLLSDVVNTENENYTFNTAER